MLGRSLLCLESIEWNEEFLDLLAGVERSMVFREPFEELEIQTVPSAAAAMSTLTVVGLLLTRQSTSM